MTAESRERRNRESGESIYPALAKHQRSEKWDRAEFVAQLQTWTKRFVVEFKVDDVANVALFVGPLPLSRLGHFRYQHNGFGLEFEVAINDRYVGHHKVTWEVLGTLLHELLHCWQYVQGVRVSRNHHNRAFRDKALSLGLLVDRRGMTGYAAESVFKDLLRRFGVEVPEGEIPPRVRSAGSSQLKKWRCACNPVVRVAVPDWAAVCLKCGHQFWREDQ